MEEGAGGRGRGAAENFTWGAELIKCIDPNKGEALKRGREGGGGQAGGKEGRVGQRGQRKFYLRAEFIKCFDPNEGEAWKRGREGGAEGRQKILPGAQN